jgi:hypothetical protein
VNILTVATATGLTSEAPMGVLGGKAALITGASRGIDRAIVDRPTRTALWWCSASSASGRR